jgi:tetratricopeptide (TPR) repeat protein
MKAYFYLALLFQTASFKDVEPKAESLLIAHPEDLSVKYRLLSFQPLFSEDGARNLIGMETGFGEMNFLVGQRAVMNGNLANAFRELTRAYQLLPDSVVIALALAGVTFGYARYADALTLYDKVLASPAISGMESQVQLGRARTLSYLKRHDEAIRLLDDLLVSDAGNVPGEKYYWRAWNRLQLGQSQPAYEDATAGLNAMRNDAIYRLAGIASFNLGRSAEARTYFENALQMNRADCDSERYLGLLDSAERNWKAAIDRFSAASSCYHAMVLRFQTELAEYEKDITGLSNSLIAAKRADIKETEALRDQSAHNASVATKNSQ